MSCCMGNNYKGSSWKKSKRQQQAERWFDNTDDTQSFDAFGNIENKKRISSEIYSRIQHDIRSNRFSPVFLLKVAAAVLAFLTVGITTFHFVAQHQKNQDQIVWSEIKSMPGHFDKIILSDSSVVYLHPGTLLKAPQEFKGHFRQVQLIEGEAFFEVKHDQEHPFVVVSGNLKTQVLGTSFIIKNYHQLAAIQVSVATGKVAVMNGKIFLGFLMPRQQLTFNRLTNQTDLGTTPPALAESWKSGEYVLNNASMQELALELQNIYGYKVIIKTPALQKSNITIQFNMKDSIRDIMDQLKLIHQVKYLIKNKEVILMK
jgi:transmembrane sensor